MTDSPSDPGAASPGEAFLALPTPGRYQSVRRADGSVDELGRGGFGKVVLARDHLIGRDVAMKKLTARRLERTGATAETRMVREARVMSQLEHPAIVPVHELGRDELGALYYTMRRIRGRTLAQALRAEATLEGRLRLLPRVLTVCQALAYAHSRGVVHRDLKPQNVMLDRFGATYVIDWGLARAASLPDDAALPDVSGALRMVTADQSLGAAPSRVGTPAYMSPEQLQGDRALIDEKSDVWGLGAMLFEVLTGGPPRSRQEGTLASPVRPVREVLSEVPLELAAICDKACAEDRAARYPSADALAQDLEAWLQGRRVSAHAYRPGELLMRFVRERRLSVAVAAAAVVLLLAGGALAYLRVREQRDQARAFAHLLLEQVQSRLSETRDKQFATRLTTWVSDWLRETGADDDTAAVAWAWFQLAQSTDHRDGAARDFVRACLAAATAGPDAVSQAAWVGCTAMELMPSTTDQPSPAALATLRELASRSAPAGNDPRWFDAQHLVHERLYLAANDRADVAEQRAEAAALVQVGRQRLKASTVPGDGLKSLANALGRNAFSSANDGRGPEAIALGEEALAVARQAVAARRDLPSLSELATLLNQQVLLLRWQQAAAGPGAARRREELGNEALELWEALQVMDPGDDFAVGQSSLLLDLARPEAAWQVLRDLDFAHATLVVRQQYDFAALASGHHRELLEHRAELAAEADFDSALLLGLALAQDGQPHAAASELRRAAGLPHASAWPPPTMVAFASGLKGPAAPALRRFIVETSPLFEQGDDRPVTQALETLAAALEALR